MSDEKYTFEMYEKLLANELEANEQRKLGQHSPHLMNWNDDGDEEVFVTSEEIVKNNKMTGKRNKDLSINDGVIEETAYFKRYTKRRKYKYTEKEIEEIRNSCRNTIVHDYGKYDIYHISDNERERNDQLSEISMKLARLKRIYLKVDQYIEAMRVVFEAWNILGKVNYLHSKEEFFEMIADGRIVSNRIIMPKLRRIKQYDIDMIIKYISNPELDPSHLLPIKTDDSLLEEEDYETEEEEMKRLLSEDEAKYLLERIDNPEEMPVRNIKPSLIKGYDRRNVKKKKNESKKKKYIRKSLYEILNKIQNGPGMKELGMSYSLTNSLFEPEKEEKSFWDKLKFTGSWSDDDQVKLYNLMIEDEIMNQIAVGERYLTNSDIELRKFYNILEENGVSVIELRRKIDESNNDEIRSKEKYKKKENKKMENAIIQRISKLNNNPKFKKIAKKAENDLNNIIRKDG